MVFYCQRCNGLLDEVRFCGPLWIAFYKCNNCGQDYLNVADPRWIFPLQPLEPDVMRKALAASEEQLKVAVNRIEDINYHTVAIDGFVDEVRALPDEPGD